MANPKGIFYFLRCCMLLLALTAVFPLRAQDTAKAARTGQVRDTVIRPVDSLTRATTPKPVVAADTAKSGAPGLRMDIPPPHSPRKAALYSAVLPGLGQAYNREYWKIPLVYAALGTCTYFFIDNMKNYRSYRDAYRIRMDGNPDTHDKYEGTYKNPASLKTLRDYYRQNLDYTVLFFVLAYGLNIVDATVFAHLKSFDMSNDLSIRISPTMINNRTPGIGVNIQLGSRKQRQTWNTYSLAR